MDTAPQHRIIGRGTGSAPTNRFERLSVEDDWEHLEHNADEALADRRVKTEVYIDATKSLIVANDSPDIPFSYSINPYRGCEHGCSYCYAVLIPTLDFVYIL